MKNFKSNRRLRLESLEERTLLAVTAGLAEPAAALAAPTGAANWVVNTTDDPSSWDETDAVVSLREAIGRAAEGDTVTFDASLANRAITLSGSQLEITKSITIDASSIGGITIDGDNVSKIFLVTGGSDAAAVELVSLILYESGIDNSGVLVMTDCSLLFPDPGIDNSGVLVMTGCSVENSFAERAVATVANTGSVSMTDCSFTNGMGRAIYNGDTGQMTMLRCEVSDCEGTISDDLYGGAVYNGGTLTMADCSVDGNFVMAGGYYHPHDGYGGGIYNGGTLTMTNCSVSGNTIPFATHCYGGGIYNGGTLIMTNCSVSRNHDRAARQCYGAGIYNAWSGTVTMTNCTMSGNKGGSSDVYNCDVYGGGVYNSGTMEMTSCTVSESVAVMCGDGKDAVGYGGGIYSSGTLTMTNCAVVRNRVESGDYDEYYYRGGKGGGIYSPGTLTLTNCTVAGNSVEGGISGDGMGGGIYNSGTVNLYNTIIAQNTASSYGNDVYRNSGSLYAYNTLSSFTDWTESENCLTYDSSGLFTDAFGGDYSLAVISSSQAIDKGNNGYISGYETDLAGNPRIYNNGTVDLGAYECQSNLSELELEPASTIVTTELDVSDPTDNLISLREAIFYAAAADTITFDASLSGQTITLAGKELVIGKTVSIDASSIGGITVDAAGKSRVFNVSGGTADMPVELIALKITGGNANVSDSNDGGGIYNTGRLKLTDCTVTGNRVSDDGGAFYNTGTLALTNCAVTGNSSSDDGGAFYNYGSSAVLTLTSCTVSGNTASDYGGGIYNSSSYASAYLYNTIIAQNTASRSGNDVYSGSVYAYNTLSSFTGWASGSSNNLTYDSSQSLFADAAGGDYTLAANSQAIDKGNNAYVETETDLAGNPRIVGGIVDLGAYEYQSGGGQTEQLAAPVISTGSRGVYVSHGANRHQIQWSAVANASGYELAYSADGVRWTTVSASGTGAVVTGLTYGADVTYRVRALGTGSYTDSDWSRTKTFNVCPMDINNDGDIAGSDRTIMASAWLAEEGDDEYQYYADINGDGEVSNTDRPFIGQNWGKEAGDDDLVYPRALRAAEVVFAAYESGGIDVDLNIF